MPSSYVDEILSRKVCELLLTMVHDALTIFLLL